MENNNLNMGIFDSDDSIELNMDELDLDEIKIDDQNPDENQNNDDNQDDQNEDNENIKPSEDQNTDSEEVAGEDQGEGDESNEQDNLDDSPDIYSSFAKVLNEQGLLPSLDLQKDKITSIDDLTELLKKEIHTQSRQELINKLGEEGVEALEKGVTLAEYQQYKQTVDTLDQVDEDLLEKDIELSKKIILEDYKAQGFNEQRALKLLKKSIDLGADSIIEDAKESLASLKEVQNLNLEKQAEQRKLEQEKIEKQQEKIDNDLKNSIYNSKEIIEGIPASKTIKDKVYNSITKPIGKSPNGNIENKLMKHRREKPVEFDTKLYYLYELTSGFSDFSKLITKSGNRAVSQFEKALRSNRKFEDSGTPDFLSDKESYGGIGPELNL